MRSGRPPSVPRTKVPGGHQGTFRSEVLASPTPWSILRFGELDGLQEFILCAGCFGLELSPKALRLKARSPGRCGPRGCLGSLLKPRTPFRVQTPNHQLPSSLFSQTLPWLAGPFLAYHGTTVAVSTRVASKREPTVEIAHPWAFMS